MLSIGEWAKQSIVKEFAWSNDVITIQSRRWEDLKGKDLLTEKVASEIPRVVPGVAKSFVMASGNFPMNYKNKDIYSSLEGTQKWYFKQKKLSLVYGNFFDKNDYLNGEKKIILGNKLVASNFKKENPVWKKIDIGWESFIVSGVLEEKNWEFDYKAYIPRSTLTKVFQVNTISSIEVIVDDPKKIETVNKNLDFYLLKLSGVKKKADIKAETRTNKEALKQVNEIVWKLSLLLWGIWAIALIVWGIGIMNIMLVSVTERTREIGIRKAIWASNKNILMQFLIESVILTLIGSLLAIFISFGIVKIVDTFISDFSPVISMNVVLIATGVSISMWISFWLMPAYKAAKLKPIDALHFE